MEARELDFDYETPVIEAIIDEDFDLSTLVLMFHCDPNETAK